MCGRTGLSLSKETLRCACSYKQTTNSKYEKPDWSEEHNDGKTYQPSYNIAPTDVTPVLISASALKNYVNVAQRLLKPMMWGIIPTWHTGDYRSHNLTTNNCRLENIKSSRLYGPALRNGGRCVIVVEGFYEWQTTDKLANNKQPYYIYSVQDESVQTDNPETWNNSFNEDFGWKGIKLLYLAGVYSIWRNKETVIYSYSVITMDSNSTLDWLHHRMPAVLDSEEQIEAWLDIKNVTPDMALGYLRPVKALSWHPVSTGVNNSRNKGDDCNKRITIEQKAKFSQKTLTTWFTQGTKRKSSEDGNKLIKKCKQ